MLVVDIIFDSNLSVGKLLISFEQNIIFWDLPLFNIFVKLQL